VRLAQEVKTNALLEELLQNGIATYHTADGAMALHACTGC